VFFYPSKVNRHVFSEEDELPFDNIDPKYIIDMDYKRIVLFPFNDTSKNIQECYLYDCRN